MAPPKILHNYSFESYACLNVITLVRKNLFLFVRGNLWKICENLWKSVGREEKKKRKIFIKRGEREGERERRGGGRERRGGGREGEGIGNRTANHSTKCHENRPSNFRKSSC
jgi:hypothetical protein